MELMDVSLDEHASLSSTPNQRSYTPTQDELSTTPTQDEHSSKHTQDERSSTPMQDEPSSTPTQDERSSTPTQDERSFIPTQNESYLDERDCSTPTLDEHLLEGSGFGNNLSQNETAVSDCSTMSVNVQNLTSDSSEERLCSSEIVDGDANVKHVNPVDTTDRSNKMLQVEDNDGEMRIDVLQSDDNGSERRTCEASQADDNDSKSAGMDEIGPENRDRDANNQGTKPNAETKPTRHVEITADTSKDIHSDQSLDSLVEEQTSESIMTSQNQTNCSLKTNSSSQIADDTSDRITSNPHFKSSNTCSKVTEESSIPSTNDKFMTAASQNDFKCTKCSLITSDEDKYKTHVCQTSTNASDAYKGQQIAITYDDSNFFCSACEVKAKGHAFEEHLMCHLVVKPYQCIYCSEAFVNRREMSQHVSVAHPGKKMNCALKALSRAKRLMAEAQKTGSFVFCAKVSGKVPLQVNPDKKPKIIKEKSDSTKSYPQSGSVLPALSNPDGTKTDDSKPDNLYRSNKIKAEHTTHGESACSKDAVKSDTNTLTSTGQEDEALEPGDCPVVAGDCPVAAGDNQVLADIDHHAENEDQSNSSIVDDGNQDTNEDLTNISVNSVNKPPAENYKSDSVLGETKVAVSSTEDVTRHDSVEMEESNSLDKEPFDSERNDKHTDTLQSVVSSEPPETEVLSGEMEVSTSDDVEGVSETSKEQTEILQTDIIKPYDTLITSSDKEMSQMVDDTDSAGIESPDSLDIDNKETANNGDEHLTSSNADIIEVIEHVTEQDENKEASASENVADGSRTSKDELNILDIKDILDNMHPSEHMNDGQEKSDISYIVENYPTGDSSKDSVNVPMDTDEKQVTSTDEQHVEDAMKLDTVKEALGNDVQVLHEEHDPDVPDSKENQDKKQEDDLSGDSQPDLSSTQASQEATDQMEVSGVYTINSENDDRTEMLRFETGSNSSEIHVENKMLMKSDKSSSLADEGQELKIVDSFSLDMDDDSFSSESVGSKINSEEVVLDEVSDKMVENNSVKSTSDDEDVDVKLQEKSNAEEQTNNATTSFVPGNIETLIADDEVNKKSTILENVLKSPDEVQPLPFSTTEKPVTPSQEQTASKPVPFQSRIQHYHMRNSNFYICGLGCSFSCLNSIEFRDHLLLEHAGEVSFACYYCGYVAHSEDSLLKHMINHAHTYNKAAPLYFCGVGRCKFGTNLLTDFLNHMQIMHSGCTAYKCRECDYMADSVEKLVKHFNENYLHVVNCPHCTCKGSDRCVILRHIAQYHPGKAKMVQVAKQMICKERKQNNFYQNQRSCATPEESETLPQGLSQIKVEPTATAVDSYVEKFESSPKIKVKKGENIEKHIEPPKCDHCTFVARDARRLQSHKNCHGLPQIKRHRFRCIYCPQGFDASAKFKTHIACHPGLIKYWIYCCRRCDFDTNQRHVILKHIKTKDDLHHHTGEDEDMFSVVERIMESRVLECEHCNFQTRHKLHLQIHYERDHRVVKAAAQSSTDRDSTPPGHSSPVHFKSPATIQVPQYNKPSRNISLTAVSGGQVQENRLKKFKCPHCQYLVPKAADLKQHVKRHDYLGKISLNIFRCKYCSSSSTARDLVFEHIREKHSGKPLQLVRKTVDIDTRGTDNTFSETSVAEAPISSSDYNPHIPAINPVMPISSSNPMIDRFHCETCAFSTPSREVFDNHLQLHNTKGGMKGMTSPDEDSDEEDSSFTEMKHSPNSSDNQTEWEPSDKVEKILQVVIVPKCVATDTLTAPARCPQCYFASGYRSAFVSHVKSLHPLVMVVMRNNNHVQEVTESGTIGKSFYLPEDLSPEVLVIPEKQVFSQAVGCPKCPNFATYFRRNLVLHIQKHHSEVTAMGYSSWGGWRNEDVTDSKTSSTSSGQSNSLQDESCIVGSGNLDEKISILYENYGAKQKCLICTLEKSKKYFMHIHILRHLDVCLWKCAYCAYQGLEKHKIKQHIKEHHPEKATSVEYVIVDIDSKVSQFLKQLGLNRNAHTFSYSNKEPLSEIASAASSPKMLTGTPDSKLKMTGPLGTPELDDKIRCLYETVNNKSRCILCSCEFTRKFAIHRHIVTNHLKIALIGCGYCDFTGVDKHYITDHILMQHPKAPIKVITLDIDIPQKVTELLSSPNPGKRGTDTFYDSRNSSLYGKGYKARQNVDSAPKAYFLGKDLLDQKLQCLYKKQPDGFKCKVCEWKFPRKYACHRHLFLKHLKINLFGCAYCHAKAVERYLIISHIKEAHPGSPPHAQILKVDIDKKISEFLSGMTQVAETLSNIKRGIDSHPAPPEEFFPEQKPDLTQVKPADTGMVVALFGRKRKDSDPVFPAVMSPVSPKKLKTTCRMTDVTTNIKVICVSEGSLKKYVCEVCRFTSLHRSNVYRHVLRVHEKYREQECQYCGYKTLSVVLMQQHIDIEHEADSLPSKLSQDDTKPVINVKQEQIEESTLMQPDIESSDEKDSSPVVKQNPGLQHTIKTYCCAYCDYETHTSENILKHTKELHCQGTNASSPSTSAATTPVSGKSSERPVLKTNVKKGMFSDNQYLNCGYCSYRSASLPEIKAHAKYEHRSETALIVSPYAWKYICKVCSLKNSAAGKMKNHINRHIEYRPYTCGSCGTSYSSSDELRKHLKNYQHADEILYIKNDKKEKKVNQLMIESRRCAEMVNLGTPFKFDLEHPGSSDPSQLFDMGKVSGEKLKTVKRMYNKPSVKKITSTWKTESLGSSVKFKFVKKKQATAQKTKFRYAQNCPFAKKVPVRVHPKKDNSLAKKDFFSCNHCSFQTAVSIEEVRKHHRETHVDEEFVWRDGRLHVTCTESGSILECLSRMKMPPVDEQFTHKQLSGKSTKFYCNRCEFSCWVLQAIKSHLRMHQPRRFLCPYCHMRYHKCDNLEKHLLSSHPNLPAWVVHLEESDATTYIDDVTEEEAAVEVTSASPVPPTAPGKQKKKKLKSKLLGPKTKRHQRLMAEFKEWRSKGQPVRRTSQTVFYCCHQCSFTSESLYLFRLHLAQHGNYRHLVTDLTSESPLKCGFCPYVAGDQNDFSLHLETHFDMRNFKCGHCSYSAYTKAHVRSHLANFHAGLEEKLIDTSSLAVVESRTEETTNMPKLVNLDPQVVLEDVLYLTDQDLDKLMTLKSENLKFDFTVRPTSHDDHTGGQPNEQGVDGLSADTNLDVESSRVGQSEGLEGSSKSRESPADDGHVSPMSLSEIQFTEMSSGFVESLSPDDDHVVKWDSEQKVNSDILSESLESQTTYVDTLMHQIETDSLSTSQGFLTEDITKMNSIDASDSNTGQSMQHSSNITDRLSLPNTDDGKAQDKTLIDDDRLMEEGNVLDEDADELMDDDMVGELTQERGVMGDELNDAINKVMEELTSEKGVMGDEMTEEVDELTQETGMMDDKLDDEMTEVVDELTQETVMMDDKLDDEMTEVVDEFTQETGVMDDDMDEVDGPVESGSGRSEAERPGNSGYDDPGNVFNTLNSWLGS
ncbi:uncharacterized protein LOC121377192 [Gigantopelta aegis]|uniref:uncharacterized protein LOC121377192 n=1 Tax=Gigantopelta aegis TaxID=1735272 RepID=UPI001B887794|nr:uncharacterized protein LOC121377192 [Gigantopelta aegis]